MVRVGIWFPLLTGYVFFFMAFSMLFRENPNVAKVFPKRKYTDNKKNLALDMCLLTGYASVLLWLTQIGTWIVRYCAYRANRLFFRSVYPSGFLNYLRRIGTRQLRTAPCVRHHPKWLLGEVIFWYLMACYSVQVWCYVGCYYKYSEIKMSHTCVTIGCVTALLTYFFKLEDYQD